MPWIPAAAAHRIVHGIRATSDGEEQKHNLVLARHLLRATADARTQSLFAQWRRSYGIDDAETAINQVLHRLGLQDASPAVRIRSLEQHPQLQPLLRVLGCRLAASALQRGFELRQFTIETLYSWYAAPPPWRGTLSSHLLEQFKGHVVGRLVGQPLVAVLEPSPILGEVPKGKRPYRNFEPVRNTDWHWRVRCDDPRARKSVEELAEQRREALRAKGLTCPSKDESGRADTKTVRDGIDEVERLLSLSVPPEEWRSIT
jgi:hypothetical protein